FGGNVDNGADEVAATIVNVNLRDRSDIVLFRYRRLPIHNIDLAQRNLRIGVGHLLQAWRELFARTAPVRVKIDNGHVARCEVFGDVHCRAMTDYFDLLTTPSDSGGSCASFILWIFGLFFSDPIPVIS